MSTRTMYTKDCREGLAKGRRHLQRQHRPPCHEQTHRLERQQPPHTRTVEYMPYKILALAVAYWRFT
jgi:hypothetical protein